MLQSSAVGTNSAYATDVTSSTASETKTRETKTDLGKDDFLKLLITQLTHQDPLNPLEDKDFIAQMAQFTSLEQLTNVSNGIASLNMLNRTSALTLMGKNVTYLDGDGVEQSGKVTGVRFDGEQVVIQMDKIETTLDNIVSVAA